jgi:two-component system, OmpR family, response regulator CpxR
MHEVLLVDDDRELRPLLERYMASHNFYLRVLHDGSLVEETLREHRIDLLILDVMLPGKNGFEILREIRRLWNIPVIMLSARGAEGDRILGLDSGADDYLPKPFNPRELIARMQAVMRRHQTSAVALEQPIAIGDLVLNPPGRSVHVNGNSVALTAAEFDILWLLTRSAGSTVSRDELTRFALGHQEQPWDRSLDTHVSNLRRKLGPDANGQRRINNVRGTGYVYTAGGGV